MYCEITRIVRIGELVDVTVRAPGLDITPGQFLHVACGQTLRRPYSICDYDGEGLRFILLPIGAGGQWLADRAVGDTLDILLPLGNGFNVHLPFSDKVASRHTVVVGGGIGVFPLLHLAKRLGGSRSAVLGFRSAQQVALVDELIQVCSTIVTTDDGSAGIQGTVVDGLEMLTSIGVGRIFACGPEPMLLAVAKWANEHNVPCEVSLEQRMGCGVGMCATCVCAIDDTWMTICDNGPVFDARRILGGHA